VSVSIRFLGTGGARFVVAKQIRASGGMWMRFGETQIHVDPGPGALVRALSIELAERHGLRVETVAGTLRMLRGAAVLDDRVLPLSPSVLTVLRCIAEANGAVVSRDDLLAALPGLSADAHAVEVAIARLRDAAGSRDLIRTVIKRGYRLETRHTVS